MLLISTALYSSANVCIQWILAIQLFWKTVLYEKKVILLQVQHTLSVFNENDWPTYWYEYIFSLPNFKKKILSVVISKGIVNFVYHYVHLNIFQCH